MRSARAFYSMPQLGDSDCGDLELLVGTGRHPFLEVERSPLAPNDDVGVKNYRHLSAGALRILRAARRSRCQALASLSGRSTLARASAKARPTQTFPLSGTRRANGSPFLNSTNVTFW